MARAARQGERRALTTEQTGEDRSGEHGAGVWTLVLAAGAVAGVAQHVSQVLRLVPLIAVPLLLPMVYRRWMGWWHLGAFGLAFLLVLAPLGCTISKCPRGDYRFYLPTDPRVDPNHGSVRSVANGVETENPKNAGELKAPPADGKGVAIFAREHHLDDPRTIEGRLPGGEERRVTAPNGRLLYITFWVPSRR